MRKYVTLLCGVLALAFAGTAAATLVPGVFDPGATGCPVATYANGVLHLEKNCPTPTNASAGAEITGFDGQTFSSASFTLANTSQCQGGSPRFNVFTSAGTFFLGCNNVLPTLNGDGSATYQFDAASLLAGGNQVPVPTGTITGVEVLIDVQGTADLSQIRFNGVLQVPAPVVPTKKADCRKGGWKTYTDPKFRNQGQCVAWVNHHDGRGKDDTHLGSTTSAADTSAPSGHGKGKGRK
jgi:hypothetical protein